MAPSQTANSRLKIHQIFRQEYKLVFCSVGVSFNRRNIGHCIILSYLAFRTGLIIFSVVPYSHSDIFSSISSIGTLAFPFITYLSLSGRLGELNKIIDEFLIQTRINPIVLSPLVQRIRSHNIVALVLMTIDWAAQLIIGFISLRQPDSWVLKSTLPFDFGLPEKIKILLVVILYMYNSIALGFICKTTSLYSCYIHILMSLRESVLSMMLTRTNIHHDHIIDSVDYLMDKFETSLSFLPFLWLFYCSGPGLCFILSHLNINHGSAANDLSTRIYFIVQTCNIIILLLVLYIISSWQEKMDSDVILFRRFLRSSRNDSLSPDVLERLSSVLTRRPTVWFIWPIDRSLILSSVGSAITFSTLFIQMKEQSDE